jgi:DNA-binding MarR family transcriptional regulator
MTTTQTELNYDAPISGIFTPSDICANNHQGNTDSVKAHEKIKESLPRKRKMILSLFLSGEYTPKQVARMTMVQLNTISGRFTELKADELLEKTGDRVDGSAVLKLTDKGIEEADMFISGGRR